MVHKSEKLIQKIKGKDYTLFKNTNYQDWWFFEQTKEFGGIPLGDKSLIPLENIDKFAKRLTQPVD